MKRRIEMQPIRPCTLLERLAHERDTYGIELRNGKDKVLVYRLGKAKGSVMELQQYEGP